MKKIFCLIGIVVLLFVSMSMAQTLVLTTRAVSPRGTTLDTTGFFDRAYNGLLNVGVETQVYLKGRKIGEKLDAPAWTVLSSPTGSAALITDIFDADTSTQIAKFIPDVEGTYVIEFSDGDSVASVTLNAGTYMGIEDGQCGLCHANKKTEWEGTGHYSLFERALNGQASPYYASFCISCHTTGYDTSANNNGFDDREFVFPDTLYPGVFDTMLVKYPDAMKLARIQCESCHGPGSDHFGNTSDSRMVKTLAAGNCAWCHDSGTHHVYPYQWDVSRHANPRYAAYAGRRAGCAPCHSGAGFVEFVENGKQPLSEAPPVTAITCAVCHDPHSDENPHQLRTVEVTLGNGMEVQGGGVGKLCMNCHKSRRNAAEYTGPNFRYSKYFGPHHGPQADVLIGTNAATFGKNLPSSAHFSAIEDACVGCHMKEGHVDEAGNVILVGSHTFSMTTPDGEDNVSACEDCHGNIGESFADKKFYMNGVADHDGDGVEEGLQDEVEGLLEALALMLPPVDTASVDVSGKYIYTLTEIKAAYNYFLIEDDRSKGIHNPAFVVSLLQTSIQALENNAVEGEIVAIEDVPNDQGKKVRIIWDKMVDDGVAADPIDKYIVQRLDGENDWTGVGEYTAYGAPRYALVVPTLYDSTAESDGMTTFRIVAVSQGGNSYFSAPASGYSIDNLVPHAPTNPMAMLVGGDVELTWEAPDDPDINFYRIYRSNVPDFDIDEATEVGTTIDIQFTDEQPGIGDWYYKIVAIDFSGNIGEPSIPVNAKITSVDGSESIPTSFDLAQNYPNPFNPETTIKFSLMKPGNVRLEIFNARGQKVMTLVNKEMAAGNFQVNFVAEGFSSGVYFYRLKVTDINDNQVQFQSMKKMILMK